MLPLLIIGGLLAIPIIGMLIPSVRGIVSGIFGLFSDVFTGVGGLRNQFLNLFSNPITNGVFNTSQYSTQNTTGNQTTTTGTGIPVLDLLIGVITNPNDTLNTAGNLLTGLLSNPNQDGYAPAPLHGGGNINFDDAPLSVDPNVPSLQSSGSYSSFQEVLDMYDWSNYNTVQATQQLMRLYRENKISLDQAQTWAKSLIAMDSDPQSAESFRQAEQLVQLLTKKPISIRPDGSGIRITDEIPLLDKLRLQYGLKKLFR